MTEKFVGHNIGICRTCKNLMRVLVRTIEKHERVKCKIGASDMYGTEILECSAHEFKDTKGSVRITFLDKTEDREESWFYEIFGKNGVLFRNGSCNLLETTLNAATEKVYELMEEEGWYKREKDN